MPSTSLSASLTPSWAELSWAELDPQKWKRLSLACQGHLGSSSAQLPATLLVRVYRIREVWVKQGFDCSDGELLRQRCHNYLTMDQCSYKIFQVEISPPIHEKWPIGTSWCSYSISWLQLLISPLSSHFRMAQLSLPKSNSTSKRSPDRWTECLFKIYQVFV